MAVGNYGDAALKHRIPVIDRMMEVLSQLERRESGLTIRDLVTQLHLPRTTIYRILNTLQMHDMVHRDENGAYQLGHRLLGLAAHVATGASEVDLVAVAQPFLDKLSFELGDSVKLSVLDKNGVLVLATSPGKREYALTVTPGQRQEAHAGSASRLLLAYLPEDELEPWLSRPMVAFTNRTITDPKRLRSELARIRRLGWAQDKGETAPSIHAFAAPVFDTRDQMVAAISVPFLAGTEPSRMEKIRLATIAAAKALTAAIPGPVVR
ncbi:MAG TPA: IclR family transcriptional regulator [Hyphomicrobiaceae bacterium]|nr:IclR family transcriptional regulator [Hyphomicrobiaceae bacterium]